MIIDFHTHIFPDKIAHKTVHNLELVGNIHAYTDGTVTDLKRSMKEANVTHSVILPIVTKPAQFQHINEFAAQITDAKPDAQGLSVISFGGIHPDSSNYKEELRFVQGLGLKGIKLHPYFQRTYIDDIKYKRIIDYASQLGLLISIHCGRDIGYPPEIYSTPEQTKRMVKDVFGTAPAYHLILAHLGAHAMEEQSEELLIGGRYYMDLGCAIRLLPPEQTLRMCRNHGIEKILFATDSPWSGQAEDLEYIKQIGFTQEELNKILYQNAAKLLGVILPENETCKEDII